MCPSIGTAYLELLQVLRTRVRANLLPLNHVSSVLCVSTHCAGAVSLVEALVDVLCREAKLAVAPDGEGLCWSHCCGILEEREEEGVAPSMGR